MTTPDGIIIWN